MNWYTFKYQSLIIAKLLFSPYNLRRESPEPVNASGYYNQTKISYMK